MIALAPWQQRSLQNADAAIAAGRLAHGLLFTGEPGLGKRAVAGALAARLLCAEPRESEACGECRRCVLLAAGTHPDFRRVTLGLRDDGRPRTEITIDQIRTLTQQLSLTAQLGEVVVTLLDPADAMNVSAANALLKTLEEPQPGRFLFLIADRPFRLPATVRSRCQRLSLAIPPRVEALSWLTEQGFAAAEAERALDATDGNPGLARQQIETGLSALRDAVAADLASIAQGRVRPFALARAWLEDRPEWRLYFAAEWVRAWGWRQASGDRENPLGLTESTDFLKLANWFDSANRVRELLPAPVRHELALGGLLLGWREMGRA